jgi:hypothetical protein
MKATIKMVSDKNLQLEDHRDEDEANNITQPTD